MVPIYRWSGQFFGFVDSRGYLFDASSRYSGWVSSNNSVWRADGSHLGEIVDVHFILRKTDGAVIPSRAPRAISAVPKALSRRENQAAQTPRVGFADALDEL